AILDPDGVQTTTPSRPATRRLLGITVSEIPSRSLPGTGYQERQGTDMVAFVNAGCLILWTSGLG
ncbi:MAG: hypothetical protein V3V71_14055, partial [Roseateles sp.]